MRFLRTVSTGRLLAVLGALVVLGGGGGAIAVAATGRGPVPRRTSLANAVHRAVSAPKVKGITANVSFTNNLIDSSDFAGQGNRDPVLQGASGRLWLSNDGRMRLELQSNNGDGQVVVDHNTFWISDPTQNTVYKGSLPASKPADKGKSSHEGIPSVAQIQSTLTRVMRKVDLSGAQPTDIAGRAAYSVTVSPKHDGGLLGSAQLAWDAANGVPLRFAVYARGNTTPVLELTATHISYGAVPASDLNVSPPAGAKVVQLSGHDTSASGAHGHASEVHGLRAVAKRVPFTLNAPKSLVGLPRHTVSLVQMGGKRGALVTYGQNLGGMAVFESAADSGNGSATTGSATTHGGLGGMRLPSVSIDGATGQELSTALGTVISFTHGKVDYTVLGSVPPAAAEPAARALAAK